jgi:hypothetical protein
MCSGSHMPPAIRLVKLFCENEAHVRSRFSAESGIDETQLEEFLVRAQDQRDRLNNRRGEGTDYR